MQTRRRFLMHTLSASTVLSFAPRTPGFLLNASDVQSQADTSENVLVVIQLSGGNDGLNTIVPFADPAYRRSRPTLAIPRSEILAIDKETGFHPAARGLADLLEADKLCIAQGVGYANPNRSHFESMDIWHTCRTKSETRPDGWLGRCLETVAATNAADPVGMHLGSEQQPLALAARSLSVPSITSLDSFQLDVGGNPALGRTINQLSQLSRADENDLLGFIQQGQQSALSASSRFAGSSTSYATDVRYPSSALAKKLKTVAQLIHAGLRTRIYYVTLDGFDTHSQQPAAHAALLREFSEGVSAFMQDIETHGHADRVLLFAFSEFGRRVNENASNGTDHGAAAPVFLTGPGLRTGLVGRHPDLEDLSDGDLKFHTDFRQIYSAILTRWLKCDSAAILNGRHNPTDVFA